MVEAQIKTNVHPYVYMTKYALQHFEANAALHTHRNLMVYISSLAALSDLTYFSHYAGTKTFGHRLANAVRSATKRSSVFGDMLQVQSVHPATVVTALNHFNGKADDAATTE